MKRYLYGYYDVNQDKYPWRDKCYGEMGEATDTPSIYVGDLVKVTFKGVEHFLIAVKDQKNNNFYPMGLWLTDLHKVNPRTVLPHYLITNEILAKYGLTYIEQEVKRMTISEIEGKLGYPIEIIS